jgi:autotransporter-associated beta strand protein
LIINRTNSNFVGVTALSGINQNLSGNVTLQAGALSLSSSQLALGSGALVFDTNGSGLAATGDVRASAAVTLNNSVQINAGRTANFLTGSAITLSGNVGGAGGLTLGNGIATPVSLTLTGAVGYAGTTVVNGGELILSGASPNGSIAASSSITVNRGGALTLGSGVGLNSDRVGNNTPFSLTGGILTLTSPGGGGNDVNEQLGVVTASGLPMLSVQALTGSSAALTVANLIRMPGTVVRARGRDLGTAAFPTVNVGNVVAAQINGAAPSASLIGGGGAADTPTRSIIPWVVAASFVTGTGDSLATYDPATGIRPLNTTTEVASALLPVNYVNPATNYLLTSPSPAVNAPVTVNSLVATASAGGVYGLAAPPTLTVGSGAVFANTTTLQLGSVAFGAAEGVATSIGSRLVFNGLLSGTGGATFAVSDRLGTYGEVILTSASPGLSGPIAVAGDRGQLVITNGNQLPGDTLTLNGGGLTFRGWTDTLAINLAVGAPGGALHGQPVGAINSGSNATRATTLNYVGNLTGSGPLYINGLGDGSQFGGATISLNGNNGGYSGLISINGGAVAIDSDARLGTNNRLVLGSTTEGGSAALLATSTFATSRSITLIGNATAPAFVEISTPSGVTLALNGTMTSTGTNPAGPGLLKSGSGTLTITNAATYSGPTGLGGGTLRLVNGGVISQTSGITIGEGSKLSLDNFAGTNLSNRLNNVTTILAGGTLELLGAPTGSSETVERLQLTANSGSIVSVFVPTPGAASSRLIFNTAGAANPLSRAPGSTVLFLSTGVIGTGTNTSEFRFVNATPTTPTLVNNVLVGGFGQDSTGAGLVGLNTQSSGVVNVRPLTPADAGNFGVQLTFTGSTGSSNVIATTNQLISASTAANALSINPGVTVQTNADLTLTTGNLIMGPSSTINGLGNIAAGAGQDLSVMVPTTPATMAVPVSAGTNTLNKTGAGTLVLQGTSPTITTLNIHQGSVNPTGPSIFTALASVNVQSGATYDSGNQNLATGSLNGSGTVNLGASGVLTVGGGNGTSNFGGLLSAGRVVKNGTGTFRFTQLAVYSGPITVNGGALEFGAGPNASPTPLVSGAEITLNTGTLLSVRGVTTFSRNIVINSGTVSLDNAGQHSAPTFTGSIDLAPGTTLNLTTATSGSFRFNGPITGGGSLSVSQGINLINGTNSFSGGTTISSTTTTVLGNNAALGSGPVTISGEAALMPGGGDRTLGNIVNVNSDFTFGPSTNLRTETLSNAFALTFTGPTNLGGGGGLRTITTTGAGNYTLTALKDGTANGIIKAGGGTLTLAGISSYSSATSINGGTLLVSGSKTGAGAVSVGPFGGSVTAVLAGGGSVAGAITVNPTGVIAPGTSAGILTTPGGIAFNSGGAYFWELAANSVALPGTNWDRIDATGAAVTISAGSRFIPAFIGTATTPDASAFWTATQTWQDVILTNAGAGATNFTIDNSAWASRGMFSTMASPSGGVSLVWTPVPEPIHILLIAAAAGVITLPFRKGHN